MPMTEDEYKYSLCELVHQKPLLWDPQNTDYKNKDQRAQVWKEIDKMLLPFKKGVCAKDVWEKLNKAYNSANNRRKTRVSGIGTCDISRWKFGKAMDFVSKVKTKRITTCNVDSGEIYDDQLSTDSDEGSILKEAVKEAGIFNQQESDNGGDDFAISESTQKKPKEVITSLPKSKYAVKNQKRKASQEKDEYDYGLEKAIQKRIEENKESVRLKFFNSIMPKVDSMNDDTFLDFQIDVLNLLKSKSIARDSGPNIDTTSQSAETWPISGAPSASQGLQPLRTSAAAGNAFSSSYPSPISHPYFQLPKFS
ncbi:uncharacterized protein LOC135483692 [Lineus longissimus]|uniref:uncharacterized protein LOC135483692 n=1 Tax=Lineus longissimus TaxID=88925 RepID=UPI002B4E727C